jgi:hypothetical protein
MNHRQAWDLIPWFINGSAPDSRSALLEHHLRECPECRAEVEAQRAIMQAMKTRPLVENMPHGSLQKLWARIDAQAVPAAEPSARAIPDTIRIRQRPPRMAMWLAAAIAMQALLLGAVTLLLMRLPPEEAAYRTVSSPTAATAAPSLRAVFTPDMTLGELQALLERAGLRIVNGPTPEGVYTLAGTQRSNADPARPLAVLRSHPATRFAEPIGSPARSP